MKGAHPKHTPAHARTRANVHIHCSAHKESMPPLSHARVHIHTAQAPVHVMSLRHLLARPPRDTHAHTDIHSCTRTHTEKFTSGLAKLKIVTSTLIKNSMDTLKDSMDNLKGTGTCVVMRDVRSVTLFLLHSFSFLSSPSCSSPLPPPFSLPQFPLFFSFPDDDNGTYDNSDTNGPGGSSVNVNISAPINKHNRPPTLRNPQATLSFSADVRNATTCATCAHAPVVFLAI